MIYTTIHVTETIFAFAIIILLVHLLKKNNIVSSGDLQSYSNLMMKAILPAVIFFQLSLNPVNGHQLILVLIMFTTGIFSMVITWITGRIMKLKNETLGMLIITSTFGSSALIGYPLIKFAFPNNLDVMSNAIVISQLGIGVPIFTLCPIVASYYGSGSSGFNTMIKSILDYLKSPIFIAVVAGIIVSQFQMFVKLNFLQPFWEALRMIEGTLWVMACVILGLQLKFRSLRRLMPLFIVSVIVQMGIQPFFASLGAGLMQVGALDRQVLILISAMPSAVLCSVFATHYKCDSETASEVVFLNIMFSLIGITLVYYSMFH